MKNFSATFKKLFKKRPKNGPAFGSDPHGDWKKIVIFFLIVNLGVLAFSGYLFWQINEGGIFDVAPGASSASDQSTLKNLKNVMSVYDAKEKQFEDLRAAKPVTSDPAL